MRPPPLIAALGAILCWLWRRLFRPLPCGWSRQFIASEAFLRTRPWINARYIALDANDGRCELCGRSKHDGVTLQVDHVRPRRTHAHLALDLRNLQVLCSDDNAGKRNRGRDWRHPSHPHRN